MAAKECRAKRKVHVSELEGRMEEVRGELRRLEVENARLRGVVGRLRGVVAGCSCAFSKEGLMDGDMDGGDDVVEGVGSEGRESDEEAMDGDGSLKDATDGGIIPAVPVTIGTSDATPSPASHNATLVQAQNEASALAQLMAMHQAALRHGEEMAARAGRRGSGAGVGNTF